LRWEDLEQVQRWQKSHKYRVTRPLTAKHLELTHFEKMNVQYAVDVISEPIEEVMVEIDLIGTLGSRDYMCMARELWLAMNDRRVYRNEEEAKRPISGLEWVTEEMQKWRKATIGRRDKFITKQTFDDVMLITEGVPAFMRYVWDFLSKHVPNAGVMLRLLSQDPLEKTFGALRQRGGGTQHVTVYSIAYNIRGINFGLLSDFM